MIIDCKTAGSLFALACLHEWQDLWAGLLAFAAGSLGFAAAIGAVRITLRSEKRRADRALDALSRGLGAEARHFARAAYEGAKALTAKTESKQKVQITDIENAVQFPSPIIYQGNSASLGSLGEQTPKIVLFYNQIDVIQQARVRLRKDIDALLAKAPVTHSISLDQVDHILSSLIAACKTAVDFLPYLKTGTSLDVNDAVFPGKVADLAAKWQRVKG